MKSSVLGDSHKYWRRGAGGYHGLFGAVGSDDDDLEDLDDEDGTCDLPGASWEQSVELNEQQLAVVGELCAGLDRVRHQLGSVIADNWTLAELEMAGKPDAVSVEVNMSTGDIISNNTNATIVNRSLVQNSFIRIQQEHGEDVAAALEQLADIVEKSESQEAADNLDAFNQELQQPQPKKAVLRSLWQGLVTSLPALTQMTDLTEKIGQLVT